jgi:hypothetical protein
MSDRCRFETDVIRAANANGWSPELREHVAQCEECAAAADTGPWMRRFATQHDREHVLPSASVVWLKSQLLQGEAAAERATRPLTVSQISAYLVVAGGWAAIMNWKWTALQTWFAQLAPSRLIAHSSHAGPSLSLSFMVMVFALASITIVLAVHTILAEE